MELREIIALEIYRLRDQGYVLPNKAIESLTDRIMIRIESHKSKSHTPAETERTIQRNS